MLLASREIEAAAKMKSDFLANMSHEIRTPMNAILGMSEMALREDDLTNAKSHIRQIKRSSGMLLTIINDILDFSKIESGKMEINMNEYVPMDMITDVVHILETRMKDKNVLLIVDIDPNLPGKLMGDDIRIKQIITNIANNAIKFTHEGKVEISVSSVEAGPKMKELQVAVKDTGIGIEAENLQKIFDSFQQVDSKRNRNIEGTGLGLAISKKLLELMNGQLKVESEYGVGSTFSFTLPQLELTEEAPKKVVHPEEIDVLVCVDNEYSQHQIEKDGMRLGCNSVKTCDVATLEDSLDGCSHLFIDMELLNDDIVALLNTKTDIHIVVLDGYVEKHTCDVTNARVVNRPLYTSKMLKLFNNEEMIAYSDEDEIVEIDFEAPEAKILVVDDNEVNLSVCVGLLKPLKVQVDTALSGMDAIQKISDKMYDIVFMDHMMPEMDGIETTHVIRRMHPEYDDVPIIALTANALENAKGMFLVEGMNDFVPKPIEFELLLSMLRNWLPADKILQLEHSNVIVANEVDTAFDIPGLNVADAIKLVGSVDIYKDVLYQYYKGIAKKSQVIQDAYDQQDWGRFTTEVHALKSASRQIGAMELGTLAEQLEHAGHALDLPVIHENVDALLRMYNEVKVIIETYVEIVAEVGEKEALSDSEITEILERILAAIDDLDSTVIDEESARLTQVALDEEKSAWAAELKELADSYEYDRCEEIVRQWLE